MQRASPSGCRVSPDRLGEGAGLAVADIAGWRPDEFGHGVALHKLRHVQPHQRPLRREHVRRQRLRQLRLACLGEAEEIDQTAGAWRPARVLPDRRFITQLINSPACEW